MKEALVILFLIVIVIITPSVYGTDFKDGTGYTPSWAKPLGQYETLAKCSELTGKTTKDGNWCFEWIAYVLDQGPEYLEKKSQKSSSTTSKLAKLLPTKNNIEKEWKIGPTIAMNDQIQGNIVGILDVVGQRFVKTDEFGDHLVLTVTISKFKTVDDVNNFYADIVGLVNEKVEDPFYILSYIDLVKHPRADAKCYGGMFGFDGKGHEESELHCITNNLLVSVHAEAEIVLLRTDYAVNDFATIILNKISNTSKTINCTGTALCITSRVTKVVDGDTIYVKNYKIRLSLTNTPERNKTGFNEAKSFTSKLCPVGSTILIDQDDKQPKDVYGRIVGKVTCSGKVLNSELLYNGHANILKQYCKKSEFSSESWAKKYGC